ERDGAERWQRGAAGEGRLRPHRASLCEARALPGACATNRPAGVHGRRSSSHPRRPGLRTSGMEEEFTTGDTGSTGEDRRRKLDRDSFDALFEQGDVEVEEVAALEAQELLVGDDLGGVDRDQGVDGLQLEEKTLVDDDVGPEAGAQFATAVDHWHFHL